MDRERIARLDEALIAAAKGIRVLDAIAWPDGTEESFLRAWRAGRRILPDVSLAPLDLSAQIEALQGIANECDTGCPSQAFLKNTAESYTTAARMLGAIGTPDFTRYSIELYRRPDEVYPTQGFSPLHAARYFLTKCEELIGSEAIAPTVPTIPAEEFAAWMQMRCDEVFDEDPVQVVVAPNITSKALAGGSRIRIHGSAMFSDLDYRQLFEHEAMVHAATMQNGKRQLELQSMRLGAPRTTRTQEGLAVLAEILTSSIDILRLERIAQRVVAVAEVLDGADFIEIFERMLAAGLTEAESFRSTQRIFRGGVLSGGSPFTKDGVYLSGLIEAHTFIRLSIHENKPQYIERLFAGRLSIGDVLRLEPLFEEGRLQKPRYLPGWASDLRRLAPFFAVSSFLMNMNLDVLSFDHFVSFEERPSIAGHSSLGS